MEALHNLLSYLDAETLLRAFGPWVIGGIAIVVFIESGVLFPFLPGDSLLITAAILREQFGVTLWLLILVTFCAAFAGDQVGFWIGKRFGRKLFKDNAKILKTEYLHEAEAFFAKYGRLALIMGRFMPIVRTFIPVAAGTVEMKYREFVTWDVIGAFVWVVSMNLIGFFLGNIPGIAGSIDKIMLVVVAVSLAPLAIKAATKYFQKRQGSARS